MTTSREREARDRFADRYREECVDLARTIEQHVIGGEWGANGYTTIAEADDLANQLYLRRGDLLPDVGDGRGWPGLYLSARTGFSVVLDDVPLEGLSVPGARITADGARGSSVVRRAGARDLPFQASRFDAVMHTDLL